MTTTVKKICMVSGAVIVCTYRPTPNMNAPIAVMATVRKKKPFTASPPDLLSNGRFIVKMADKNLIRM